MKTRHHAILQTGAVAPLLLVCFTLHGASPSDAIESWVSTPDLRHALAPQPPLEAGGEADVGAQTIRIHPNTTYQRILGLGASLEHTTCANLWRLSPEKRAEVMERLVSRENGIGMNTMRICMGTPDFTGDPWYTYNDMPPGEKDPELAHFSIEKDRAYILPVLQLAREKNPELLFYASPWSPPGWMKTGDDHIGGHLYPRYYDAYARYFVKFIRAYAAEGIPIYAVTVQNEPGVNKRDDVRSWWYPSCQWSLVEDEDTWWPVNRDIMGLPERDFIREHLGPTFDQAGISTKIWCFDHNFNNLWYPRNILSDPEAAKFVDGTAFHPYVGEPEAMGEFLKEFPDKPVYLTEGSTFGLKGAADIIAFFRNGASSYNAWVTMIDSNGGPNNGPFVATETCIVLDAETLEVRYNFDYYMYGQFMKFIERSAVRIDSGENLPDIQHVAFRNPGGAIVLIAVNQSERDIPLTVSSGGTQFNATAAARSVTTYRAPAN
ncbi:MAG: glycosyl hydrolase [Candidatus Hydrogenedentes bacterium]|nr:glycosyl hydrolase [Candidatus Hydrogenedentota bacterium]